MVARREGGWDEFAKNYLKENEDEEMWELHAVRF